MKFVNLLNPYELPPQDPLAVGLQQRRARERFPELVAVSRLRYWRGMEDLRRHRSALVVVLAASYALPELRLADAIDDGLAKRTDDFPVYVCDVFDNDALTQVEEALGRRRTYVVTPLAAYWRGHEFVEIANGKTAFELVLRVLQFPVSIDPLYVLPPPRELFD